MGYHTFVLYYHTKDKAKYPVPQEDLACAIREIGNNADKWNVEMGGYSVWGSSVGGHLAGSFGTESMGYAKYGLPKPGTIVLCYPVVPMGKLTHQGAQENLLGKEPSEDMVCLASIEGKITPNYGYHAQSAETRRETDLQRFSPLHFIQSLLNTGN